MFGFYPDGPNCEECPELEGCAACLDATTCAECLFPYWFDEETASCWLPDEHCLVKPMDYLRDHHGNLWCPECAGNRFWHEGACTMCGDIYDDCVACGMDGCTECAEGYEQTDIGTCSPEIDRCDDASYADHDLVIFEDEEMNPVAIPMCHKCDNSWFSLLVMEEPEPGRRALEEGSLLPPTGSCVRCRDHGPEHCDRCVPIEPEEHDGRVMACTRCHSGLIPSPMGDKCVPRIDHCADAKTTS